jgi:lysyl-tRNA synthetase class 2
VNLEAFASDDRYLITSPEFHMKRLLGDGFMRLYQICRCFRRGEMGELHNPEFTMLEFYAAGLSLEAMMKEIEEVIQNVAATINVSKVQQGDGFRSVGSPYLTERCSLLQPWERISVDEAFRRHAGWSPLEDFDEERFYFDLVDKVDRHLGGHVPTILFHYPAPLAMLAQLHPADARLARRFEVYIAGIEIANAFEELTDPDEQRRRFEADLERRRSQKKALFPIDEALLRALPHLPPCSGIAVGVDRLVMLLLGANSIEEIMAFPESRL